MDSEVSDRTLMRWKGLIGDEEDAGKTGEQAEASKDWTWLSKYIRLNGIVVLLEVRTCPPNAFKTGAKGLRPFAKSTDCRYQFWEELVDKRARPFF